jgi:two-component system phosphate regulon response regulator PhoB
MKPLRILVVEDDPPLNELLKYNLCKEGYHVVAAGDGEEALAQIADEVPDLVLLDWMLPKLSGVDLCRQLRSAEQTRAVPVIILTARVDDESIAHGLDAGADDYIAKPVSMIELFARVRAALRRAKPPHSDDVAHHGDISLDRVALKVLRGGDEIHLGPREFKLLDYLIRHPRRVFTREQLLDAVWGADIFVEARTVDVHIARLRKALMETGRPDPVRTVRSAGYSLDGGL